MPEPSGGQAQPSIAREPRPIASAHTSLRLSGSAHRGHYNSVDRLKCDTVVTPADQEGAAEKQKLGLQQSDAVLIHTGW
jgi:hypothetical protein